MKYGLIGEKLSHSFSPEIHKKIGDYPYALKELGADEVEPFIKAKDFCAINVTIPYKKTVIPYLDYISDEAKQIGAVNTIVNKNGVLYGYNTDFEGLKDLIMRVTSGKALSGKVLILGTGGTSLTANAVCRSLGADEILTVSRSERDGCISYENAYQKHSDASYIINCTPCGMYPKDSECPIDLLRFPSLLGVVDAIYNPLRTSLIRTAKRMGVRSEGGLYMLVSQAVRAYGYFFDKAPDTELNERVYSEILNEKQNIVLIGMPSCGKSTVGKRLCELLGANFIDTDEMIVKKSGSSIPDIFEKYGEQYFRDIESEVIREISSGVTGTVISTGGGAVLRNENLDLLRANGILVFLDRDLNKLVATSDRPLTSDLEALRRKYNDRYPIYNRVCDIRVNGNESVDEVAQSIMDRLKGGQK
jgi:shikimate dehydrogenase